jgi:GGDEF domain-containing protein
MDRARREGGPLALALVHLNRADAVAAEGPVVLAAAEKALKTALQASAPDQRIERFGELVYGVFYRAPVPEVEAWAARLQSSLAEAGGWLEGGVSIGVAVLQDRHQTPDQFRADATEALREAYESGSCIILE